MKLTKRIDIKNMFNLKYSLKKSSYINNYLGIGHRAIFLSFNFFFSNIILLARLSLIIKIFTGIFSSGVLSASSIIFNRYSNKSVYLF